MNTMSWVNQGGAGSSTSLGMPGGGLPGHSRSRPVSFNDDSGCTGQSASGHFILLVEDNSDVADSMAMLLRLFGHEVVIAVDGQQGVDMALEKQPTAILLDIGLPRLNGYEACRAIRRAGLTGIPIIAVTGYNQPEDRKKSREAGFDSHMVKPVDMDELQKLLMEFPGSGSDRH